MNIARLEGFYAVAQHRSFRRAARLFSYPITPAGLHQQIRRLQVDLGAKLIERRSRDEMGLTAEGEQLLEFIRPFFEGLPTLKERLTTAPLRGTLRLMSSIHLLKHFLAPVLRRFRTVAPGVSVTFLEAREPDMSLVWLDHVDLFVDFIPQLLPGLGGRVVGELRGHLVLPQATRQKTFNPSQLKNQTFIAYAEGRANRFRQMNGLSKLELKPSHVMSAESSETILALVSAGMGYSLLPLVEGAALGLKGVHSIPLSQAEAKFPVRAVYRARGEVLPAVKQFLSLLPAR
ncbi:MAG: LysR family transcriptional regulator [Myxococcaceae bacterium]|nr:LysR family transcriptional regulator [Myxococcaceae bacterium]